MSGGYFDYKQRVCLSLIEELKELGDLVNTQDKDNPDDFSYYNYVKDKDNFNEVCKQAIISLNLSFILVQRLDWFISGDDGEDNFKIRLLQELENLKERILDLDEKEEY